MVSIPYVLAHRSAPQAAPGIYHKGRWATVYFTTDGRAWCSCCGNVIPWYVG